MRLPIWLGTVAYIISYPAIRLGLSNSRRSYIILIHQDRVLVTKNWLGYKRRWRLPGGGLHKNEQPLHGALREMREELGLKLPPSSCKMLAKSAQAKRIDYTFWVYSCQLSAKPEFILSFDTITAQWVPYKQLNKRDMSEELETALELAKTSSILV